MKYLKNFENYTIKTDNSFVIYELNIDELFDILNEGYSESLIKCPCNLTKNKGVDLENIGKSNYKDCCKKYDYGYLKSKIKREFYNHPYGDCYIDPSNNLEIELDIKHHWLERLYRKSDKSYANNPEIFNPTIDEGIDLIIKNIDKISNYIKKTGKEFYLELIKFDSINDEGRKVPYNMIVAVNKRYRNRYSLALITQIKGKKLYNKSEFKKTSTTLKMESSLFESDNYTDKIVDILKLGDVDLAIQLSKSVGVDFSEVLYRLMSGEYNCTDYFYYDFDFKVDKIEIIDIDHKHILIDISNLDGYHNYDRYGYDEEEDVERYGSSIDINDYINEFDSDHIHNMKEELIYNFEFLKDFDIDLIIK